MKKIIVLLSLSTVLFAGNLSFAMEALERGDFKTAVEQFKIAAQQGDPLAQQNLAVMYNNGFGVEKDTQKASYWFEQSASTESSAKVALK